MPVRVVGAKESAERDRAAIEKGTPSRVLMQRAGKAAASEISRRYADRLRRGVAIFTGPGNNGGDGWVIAGLLSKEGIPIQVFEVGEARTPDAISERTDALAGLHSIPVENPALVIDAVLGTGAEGEPRGKIAEAVDTINTLANKGARTVSLDIPSGLDATTGAHSKCVRADLTLSFGGVKRGSLIARDECGEIVVLDIGLEGSGRVSQKDKTLPALIDAHWVRERIPEIRFDAHKGQRKHLALVGGGKGMPGAVVLAAHAALRSGIGLLRVVVAPENAGSVLEAVPASLISEWPENDADTTSLLGEWAHALVVGPGLGKSATTRALIERLLTLTNAPVLLDADALNLFESDTRSLASLLQGRVALITPHIAEFSRLAGLSVEQVLASRFDVGVDLATSLNATVLLKGSPTVVFTPSGERFVVARGTAALGTGGSGDLLSGIAGTLLAQTQDPTISACCAAWVHGRAAEFCEYVRGTTLDDVLYALPRAWNENEQEYEPPVLAVLPAVPA
ncbi:MAG TPA: NAD(P)H-hydrate dehydratase [Gemmatimonadaceae bacterium]|nr:NAD(P)H-hydrate dehydratase [Gemmatimonadaceae bacterium]